MKTIQLISIISVICAICLSSTAFAEGQPILNTDEIKALGPKAKDRTYTSSQLNLDVTNAMSSFRQVRSLFDADPSDQDLTNFLAEWDIFINSNWEAMDSIVLMETVVAYLETAQKYAASGEEDRQTWTSAQYAKVAALRINTRIRL